MILEHIIVWQQAERHDARRLGLSTSAYHLLCLVASDDGQRVSDYAKVMGQSVAATSSLLESLEKWGWARKSRKLSDRRAWAIHLTDAGAKSLAEIHETKPLKAS